MIQSILTNQGYKVGLFTSPHLVNFTERIRIDYDEIIEEAVITLTCHIKKTLDEIKLGDHITFFEFTTAIALLYFFQMGVDIAILEVGMGGRLDSTNIVENPLISIITNVSLDHQQYLGKKLGDIAYEKAGIIKHGGRIITGENKPGILKVLKDVADEKRAKIYRLGQEFKIKKAKKDSHFNYYGLENTYRSVTTNLFGMHQMLNAAQAIAAIEIMRELGYNIEDCAIYSGLQHVKWPGRLEVVCESPRVLVDGAHNRGGVLALKKVLTDEIVYRRLVLVLGIMVDKDYRFIISHLAPLAEVVIVARPKMDRSAPPELLVKEVEKFNTRTIKSNSVSNAIKKALALASLNDLICVTGSLFTVGEAKEFFAG